jgi:hypothetical protein
MKKKTPSKKMGATKQPFQYWSMDDFVYEATVRHFQEQGAPLSYEWKVLAFSGSGCGGDLDSFAACWIADPDRTLEILAFIRRTRCKTEASQTNPGKVRRYLLNHNGARNRTDKDIVFEIFPNLTGDEMELDKLIRLVQNTRQLLSVKVGEPGCPLVSLFD